MNLKTEIETRCLPASAGIIWLLRGIVCWDCFALGRKTQAQIGVDIRTRTFRDPARPGAVCEHGDGRLYSRRRGCRRRNWPSHFAINF